MPKQFKELSSPADLDDLRTGFKEASEGLFVRRHPDGRMDYATRDAHRVNVVLHREHMLRLAIQRALLVTGQDVQNALVHVMMDPFCNARELGQMRRKWRASGSRAELVVRDFRPELQAILKVQAEAMPWLQDNSSPSAPLSRATKRGPHGHTPE